MRSPSRALSLLAAALGALLLASSCAPRLGWGLLLWNDQEAGLHAGAVVPVYIKSNIEKQYVIGVPGGKRKVELPLWQLELFRSKRAAEKARLPFGPYLTSYLFANRDGLPVRDAPSNSGRRVYRLRAGQSVKVLSEAKGDQVETGGQTLAGSWFQVLTEDGTRGYVFSNTMRLYDELTESPPSLAQSSADDAARNVDLVFSRTWRAEYFQAMIDDGRVDLDIFNARYGLFADAVRRQIRIELPAVSQVFNYSSIAQSGQDFLFEGTPLRIRLDGSSRLIADWSGSSGSSDGSAELSQTGAPGTAGAPDTGALAQAPAQGSAPPASPSAASAAPAPMAGAAALAAGAAGSTATPLPPPLSDSPDLRPGATQAVFVTLNQDIRDVIRGEENRRINLLGRFADGGESWSYRPEPSASAPSGPSLLTISRAGSFIWTGIDAVPAEYLGGDLGDVSAGTASGEATVRLVLDPSLTGWEGSLSLRFAGARDWLDFLYRHEGGRLLLQPLAAGGVRDLVALSPSGLQPLAFDPAK